MTLQVHWLWRLGLRQGHRWPCTAWQGDSRCVSDLCNSCVWKQRRAASPRQRVSIDNYILAWSLNLKQTLENANNQVGKLKSLKSWNKKSSSPKKKRRRKNKQKKQNKIKNKTKNNNTFWLINNRIFLFLDDFMICRWLTSTFVCIYTARRYYYFAEKHYRMLFPKTLICSRKCISAYKYSPMYK